MQKVKLDTDAPHEKLSDLVRSIAHFHWHLKRKWCCRPQVLDLVRIKFSELDQILGSDEDLGYTFVPKADTRVELSPDTPFQLSVGSKAEMDQLGASAPRYGFTVRSRLRRPLYVSMFHFDISNFRIMPYYQPPNAGCGDMAPSLPINGVLEIGYGQSGSW